MLARGGKGKEREGIRGQGSEKGRKQNPNDQGLITIIPIRDSEFVLRHFAPSPLCPSAPFPLPLRFPPIHTSHYEDFP